MSKAFTKEDEDAGFELPASSLGLPPGPFRLTHLGARLLEARKDPRLAAALARAEVLPPVGAAPERAALGVTVTLRGESGDVRRVRLVTAEEHAFLGEGCSVSSPLGRKILGAAVGDVREVKLPRGVDTFEVQRLDGEEDFD